MNKKIFFIILSTIFFLNLISAFGITPGRTTINFEPGLEKEIEITITNSENEDMTVVLYVKGELAKYVNLNKEYIDFASNEKSKTFKYTIKLPESVSEKGLKTSKIVALKAPKGTSESGAVVGATVAVASQLYLNIPYEGKAIDAQLDIIEPDAGGEAVFLIPVINRGEENIDELYADIEIYSNNELIDTISTTKYSLEKEKRIELSGKWTPSNIGEYKAKAIIKYDENEEIIEKNFFVGEAELEIELITVKDFELGEIAKFNILVNNHGSETYENVYVNMKISGEQGETIANFKTPNYEVLPNAKTEMNSYWDTEDVEKGLYDGILTLKYRDQKREKSVKVKVEQYSLEVLGLTGKVIVSSESSSNTGRILIVFLIILAIVNAVWFILWKQKKRKK